MKRLALGTALVLAMVVVVGSTASAQSAPEFRLSFKALADQIPGVVGMPLENEHWTASGDLVQRTSRGLLVWRMSDRWTAFTDGGTTWILGPYGLQSRSNSHRYPWELLPAEPSPSGPPAVPYVPPTPAPPTPTSGPPTPIAVPPIAVPAPPAATPVPFASYIPDVKAMDYESGGPGVMVKSFVLDLDAEWARVWGWRPHRPATIYLYRDGYGLADGMTQVLGLPLTSDDILRIVVTNAVARGNDRSTGGWAILVNLGYRWGYEDWESTIQALLVHEYSHIMQTDLAGHAGPAWFREGIAQWSAYTRVTTTAAEEGVTGYAATFHSNGTLPSLMTLNSSWNEVLNTGPQQLEAAYGAAYLSVKYLTGRVGGMPLLQTLQRTAAGESFETALERTTGYSINRLEAEYRSSVY